VLGVILDPADWVVSGCSQPSAIIRFEDACLVRDGTGHWHLGMVTGEDRVTCFMDCGDDLERAMWEL
jgi:hypothetical protein